MNILFERILKSHLKSALVFFFLIFGLYYSSIDNSFQYDDKHSIVENPHIRSLGNVPMFWLYPEFFSRDPENAMYRPVVLSTLAFNYAISDYQVESYHLLNILIHSICCYCVFLLLLLVGGNRTISFVCTLFLAIHPLCSQSVNYVSSRSELLAALGLVAALVAYVRYAVNRTGPWIFVSILFYCFALFSKSIAIIYPLWIMAYDFQNCRSLSLKRYFPFLLISFLYLLFTKSLLINAIFDEPVRTLNVQFATQCKALAYYFYLIFFPVGQNIDHAFIESYFFDFTVILVTVFVFSFLYFLVRRKYFLLGSVIAFSSLIPTFVVPLNVMINENRLYIPLIGLCILISTYASRNKLFFNKGMLIILAVFFVLFTSKRNEIWSDEFSLWHDANKKNPYSYRAGIYLGHQLRKMKDFQGALHHFERVLELKPNNPVARAGLALTLQQKGELKEAVKEYKKTLNEHPEMKDLNYNIGLVFQLMHQNQKSIEYYTRVGDDSPHFSLSLNNLGAIYENMAMIDSAFYYYRHSFQLGNIDAKKNLGRLEKRFIEEIEDSLELGEWNKAEALCRKMLDLYEAHQLGEFYFVISLFEQRRFQESLVENRKLISKFPDFFEGHLQLANNLETVQDFSGAISVYLQLLDMPLKADFEDIVLKRLNKLTNRDK